MKRLTFVFACICLFLVAGHAKAVQIGTPLNFTVDPSFDISGRTEMNAVLVKEADRIYFYLDKIWWDSLNPMRQSEVLNSLSTLDVEFENTIYPKLTSAYGSEWSPGVDGDPKITILVQQMKEGSAGYFREADEHLKIQIPDSNEREMVYLASQFIETPLEKSLLAHEFTHVITFNQKNRIRHVVEDTWLNEARAEYASTLLGYNSVLQGSVLQTRINAFLQDPTTPLVEWKGRKQDYGIVSLFVHYLVDHYGAGILIDSLHSDKVGIPSLNEALRKNGFSDVDFSKIFTDWSIAVFLNDCQYGKAYCYLNQNLTDIKLTANTNFLPFTGKSTLSVEHATKNWTGNWLRFIGGQGALEFSFTGLKGLNYRVPYFIQDKDKKYTVNFLTLDDNQKGKLFVSHFGTENKAFIAIPSLQTRTTGFEGNEPTYPLLFTVSILERTPEEEQALITKLVLQVDLLQKEIAKIQAQIKALRPGSGQAVVFPESCVPFAKDLVLWTSEHIDVYCLQKLLAGQGSDIYPEGLITGNFGPFTQQAVIRFQEKYASEILSPLGLQKGNGFVGAKTRAKLNQFLK